MDNKPEFRVVPSPNPVPGAERARILENLGFGKVFTDHMVTVSWDIDKGWHDASVRARGPFQLDPEFRTTFPTPNHPSYPAAHACYSTASAVVLARLFPADAASLAALARESGESRVWAGIHYPSDVAAGQQLGRNVAARAVERAQDAPR